MTAGFFYMDGYGGYIWSAYLVAALVLGAMVAITLRSFYKSKKTFSILKPDHEA